MDVVIKPRHPGICVGSSAKKLRIKRTADKMEQRLQAKAFVTLAVRRRLVITLALRSI